MSVTNGQIASNKVKPVYDASGNVVGLSAGDGGIYPPQMTWAELQVSHPASSSIAGMHAWCIDYPSVSGFGAEVVCTGSRWRSVSQQHCLINVDPVALGLLFAAGDSETLFSSVLAIPGGILEPGDRLQLLAEFQHPTIGSVVRGVNVRIANSEAGILSGDSSLSFRHTSGANKYVNVNKVGLISSNTSILCAAANISGPTAINTAQLDNTIPDIDDAMYMAITALPSADSSVLMFSASVMVFF